MAVSTSRVRPARITDLSAPDRLGSLPLPFVPHPGIPVLTVVMGASMLVQQWMTSAAIPDPAQRKMMYMMPVVFTWMFLKLPSGLVLYWLVNNLLGIGQQYLVNKEADAQMRAQKA